MRNDMIYIKQTSIVNLTPLDDFNIKDECKKRAKNYIRRTDRFIQLAILGVSEINKNAKIDNDTALYLTSGQGNTSVFKRNCHQIYNENMPPKPVDFINSLSNTAGFYIAQFLELNGKNINISHNGFVAQTALLLATFELKQKKQRQILIGGVDELNPCEEMGNKYLGVLENISLGQGSNWQLLSMNSENALGSIEVYPNEMDLFEVKELLIDLDKGSQIAFGYTCPKSTIIELEKCHKLKRFSYESTASFYETLPFYVLNYFIKAEKGKLIFVDHFENKFRIIKLESF